MEQLLSGITPEVAGYLIRLDSTHHNTCVHSICTAYYAIGVLEQLGNTSCRDIVIQGALLHDIGKAQIPNALINKSEALSMEEREIVNQHPLLGARVLSNDKRMKKGVITIALAHHERLNGSGYPYGICEIPLEVSIVSAADVYEALTGKREYKRSYNQEEAMEILRLEASRNSLPKHLCEMMKNEIPLQETERQALYCRAIEKCQAVRKLGNGVVKTYETKKL